MFKKFVFILAASLLSIDQAGATVKTLISERTESLNVDVSTAMTRLSGSGYATVIVKVLIPELADVTLFDHRNPGEGAPCMATYEALEPEEVIQGRPGVEKVDFKITLNKVAKVNELNQKCEILLEEHIQGNIRGFDFFHFRSSIISTRLPEDCR
jgi:hypothetical protein